MNGALYLAVKLLLGPETKVTLKEVRGMCAIFVNGENTTEFVGSSWQEALWKVRDFAFHRCERENAKLSTALAGEMRGSHTDPAKGTESLQNGDEDAPTKSSSL